MSDGWLHRCATGKAQVSDGGAFRVFWEGKWGVEAGLAVGCFLELRFKRV